MAPSIRHGMILSKLRSILALGKSYCHIIYLAAEVLSQISSSTVPLLLTTLPNRMGPECTFFSLSLSIKKIDVLVPRNNGELVNKQELEMFEN